MLHPFHCHRALPIQNVIFRKKCQLKRSGSPFGRSLEDLNSMKRENIMSIRIGVCTSDILWRPRLVTIFWQTNPLTIKNHSENGQWQHANYPNSFASFLLRNEQWTRKDMMMTFSSPRLSHYHLVRKDFTVRRFVKKNNNTKVNKS